MAQIIENAPTAPGFSCPWCHGSFLAHDFMSAGQYHCPHCDLPVKGTLFSNIRPYTRFLDHNACMWQMSRYPRVAYPLEGPEAGRPQAVDFETIWIPSNIPPVTTHFPVIGNKEQHEKPVHVLAMSQHQ